MKKHDLYIDQFFSAVQPWSILVNPFFYRVHKSSVYIDKVMPSKIYHSSIFCASIFCTFWAFTRLFPFSTAPLLGPWELFLFGFIFVDVEWVHHRAGNLDNDRTIGMCFLRCSLHFGEPTSTATKACTSGTEEELRRLQELNNYGQVLLFEAFYDPACFTCQHKLSSSLKSCFYQ